MVKRQTVWLSTMMVLSLMLIGYYTMNNGPQSTTVGGSGLNVTTAATVPDSQGNVVASGQQTAGNSVNASVPQPNSNDWFVIQQTSVSNSIAQQENTLLNLMSNNNTSSDQLTAAQQQMQKLQTLQGSMENARDAVLASGYTECAVVPNASGDKIYVWVKAASLSPTQAVSIMNTVSEQMSLPINEVNVYNRS